MIARGGEGAGVHLKNVRKKWTFDLRVRMRDMFWCEPQHAKNPEGFLAACVFAKTLQAPPLEKIRTRKVYGLRTVRIFFARFHCFRTDRKISAWLCGFCFKPPCWQRPPVLLRSLLKQGEKSQEDKWFHFHAATCRGKKQQKKLEFWTLAQTWNEVVSDLSRDCERWEAHIIHLRHVVTTLIKQMDHSLIHDM